MPNVNAPNGFKPLRHAAGGTIRENEYPIVSGYGTAIYCGDVVVQGSDGLLARAAAGDTNIIGVFQGVYWVDPDGTPRFEKKWPANQTTLGSANARAVVIDDPYVVFEAQTATGVNLTQSMFGNNVDIVATAGNDATGMSKESLSLSAPGAGAAQVRLLGLIPGRDDSNLGDSARVECMFQEHLLRTVAGI